MPQPSRAPVASACGVATAHRLKEELTASGEAVLPDRTRGMDGRSQPARKPQAERMERMERIPWFVPVRARYPVIQEMRSMRSRSVS